MATVADLQAHFAKTTANALMPSLQEITGAGAIALQFQAEASKMLAGVQTKFLLSDTLENFSKLPLPWAEDAAAALKRSLDVSGLYLSFPTPDFANVIGPIRQVNMGTSKVFEEFSKLSAMNMSTFVGLGIRNDLEDFKKTLGIAAVASSEMIARPSDFAWLEKPLRTDSRLLPPVPARLTVNMSARPTPIARRTYALAMKKRLYRRVSSAGLNACDRCPFIAARSPYALPAPNRATQRAEERRKRVKELDDAGMLRKEIAHILNCTVRTVYLDLKRMK